MIIKKNALFIGIFFAILVAVGSILTLGKAREEVSITISREAFMGPRPNTPLIQRRKHGSGNLFVLSMTLTPAPWPAGTREIWDGTSRGRAVHITVIDANGVPKFDVKRDSFNAGLEVFLDSKAEAEKLAKVLGIDVVEKVGDRDASSLTAPSNGKK